MDRSCLDCMRETPIYDGGRERHLCQPNGMYVNRRMHCDELEPKKDEDRPFTGAVSVGGIKTEKVKRHGKKG